MICNICGIDKPNNEFYTGRKYCKVCFNNKRKVKGTSSKNLNVEEKNIINIFSDEEIKTLKEVISIHNNFKNIDFSVNKSDRIRKTYNLERVLTEKISQLAHEKNITDSDMLNLIVQKFFNISS
jgi:uncharacterized Zn finger protein (UPF0148 family)